MAKENEEENEEENEDEFADLDENFDLEEELESISDEEAEETLGDEETEETIGDESLGDEQTAVDEGTIGEDFADFNEIDFQLGENELNEGEEMTTAVAEKQPKKAEAKEIKEVRKAPEKGPISAKEIPLSVVVEMGRIQMTMDKLLQLEPGNLLDLEVHPEDGVDLVINGKLVGKAELIKIGDSIGIRILELGNSP